MIATKFQFTFKPIKVKDRSLVHEWLIQPHIAEWIHGIGLQNTLNGMEQFFQGESNTTYWIGYDKDTPFAFLITSPEGDDATTLDLFICDLNYLGKGIAVPMIREFLISQFSNVKRVLIDPEATNKRAIHVYQKVGFKIIEEFIARWHPVPHYQMELYMKDLLGVKTKRLVLRPWYEDDFEPFAQMNSDPRVMEYFPSILSRQESDALAQRISTKLQEQGWGLWAVSVPEVSNFIGFIGLSRPSFSAHFTPAVEVGWRLAYDFWGQGYATEGALEALKYGFETLNLNEIVSITAVKNDRSRGVMKKIGMHHDPVDDFDHPKVPEGHQLRHHVLYRLNQNEWMKR